MFVAPILMLQGPEQNYAVGLCVTIAQPNVEGNFVNYALIALGMLNVILLLLAIFSFKKRSRQITLGKLAIITQILLIAGIFFGYEVGIISLEEGLTPHYHWGAFISLVPLLTNFLAVRAVKKDEALIRAADRLR